MTPAQAMDALRTILRSPSATPEDVIDMVTALRSDAEDWGAEIQRSRAERRPSFDASIQAAAEGRRGARARLAQALSDAALTVPGAAFDAADLLIIARCASRGMPRPPGIEYRPHRVGGEP